MSDETTDTERLLADLRAEQQRSADLAATVAEWDLRCRMMARAVAERNVKMLQAMAADLLSPGTRETVRAIHTAHGTDFSGWPVQVLAMGMIEYLDDLPAQNHVVIDITAPPRNGRPRRRLALTGQWADGQTPQQRIAELLGEVEGLRAELAHKAEEWAESAAIEAKRADAALARVAELEAQVAALLPDATVMALRRGDFIDTGCSRDARRFKASSGDPWPACGVCGAEEDGECRGSKP